jgi:hypothetical protein
LWGGFFWTLKSEQEINAILYRWTVEENSIEPEEITWKEYYMINKNKIFGIASTVAVAGIVGYQATRPGRPLLHKFYNSRLLGQTS